MKRTRIRPISAKRSKHLALRAELVPIVWARDKGRCVDCGARVVYRHSPSEAVHEIIPRSQFGNKTMGRCFRLGNMCLLCPKCHADAANQASRYRLLVKLRMRHRYDYSDGKWATVLKRGEDG